MLVQHPTDPTGNQGEPTQAYTQTYTRTNIHTHTYTQANMKTHTDALTKGRGRRRLFIQTWSWF